MKGLVSLLCLMSTVAVACESHPGGSGWRYRVDRHSGARCWYDPRQGKVVPPAIAQKPKPEIPPVLVAEPSASSSGTMPVGRTVGSIPATGAKSSRGGVEAGDGQRHAARPIAPDQTRSVVNLEAGVASGPRETNAVGALDGPRSPSALRLGTSQAAEAGRTRVKSRPSTRPAEPSRLSPWLVMVSVFTALWLIMRRAMNTIAEADEKVDVSEIIDLRKFDNVIWLNARKENVA